MEIRKFFDSSYSTVLMYFQIQSEGKIENFVDGFAGGRKKVNMKSSS